MNDLKQCIKQRENIIKHKTKVIFIGDSRIRQHLEMLISLIKELHPIITTHEVSCLNFFYTVIDLKNSL